MLRTVALTLLLFQTPANPAQLQSNASIQGAVLNAVSGEPIDRARITLTRITPLPTGPTAERPTAPPEIPPAQTARDGKFIFRDLDPGQYRLRVQRNGYGPQEYGQRTAIGPGTTITLLEGQQLKDIAFRLIPGGTVSGRIRDSLGEPVAGFVVSLTRNSYDSNGQRNLTNVAGATTDDRGEYRMYWVPPGRYILRVSTPNFGVPDMFLDRPAAGRTVLVDRLFPMTYYPGVLDASLATTLDIQPGAELSAIDVVLSQAPSFRLRGRVVEGPTGKPPQIATIWLGTQTGADATKDVSWTTNNITYNNTNGTFEIRNVMPGRYLVGAQSNVETDQPVNLNFTGTAGTVRSLINSLAVTLNSDYLPIPVSNADVEGIELTLAPPVTIPVRLRLDGQDLSSLSAANLNRIRVNLEGISAISTSVFQEIPMNTEGATTLTNISPGEYRVGVALPAPGYYLKEAFLERVDVLSRPWEINNRTSGTLHVLLSDKSGKIEGKVFDALSQPVYSHRVVLVPDQGRDRTDLYRITSTGQDGRYSFSGLTPGVYRLYSWETVEENSWFDPVFLTQFDTPSKRILLEESATETINLQSIPASKNP